MCVCVFWRERIDCHHLNVFINVHVCVCVCMCVMAELLITAGGENLAPVPIEDRIKKQVPFLSNVMVIGDKRKYLSCVVTLKVGGV